MSQLNPGESQQVIRISREEASGPHVDDLLRRQASLRGEGGVGRDRKTKWYYRNWFVFSLVGLAAAVGGWAIIEPYMNDMAYIQGKIEAISDPAATAPVREAGAGSEEAQLLRGFRQITVNGEKICLPDLARVIMPDGTYKPLRVSDLRVGQEVGVYVDSVPIEIGQPEETPNPLGRSDKGRRGTEPPTHRTIMVNCVCFVVPEPPANPPKSASLPLQTLMAQSDAASMVFFGVVAALVGLAIGASDGIICRLFRRAVIAGGIGLVVGFIGGLVSHFLAGLVYTPFAMAAMKQHGSEVGGMTTFGFLIQLSGRALGWAMAGTAMGLGQGIALRSSRLIIYGLLGGVIGGLMGGLFFDPIDLLVLGGIKPSSHLARLAGVAAIGVCVGLMIGIVELLARDAWLRMVQGPLAGKEFLIFKDTMFLGSSPRSEIYLFNDADVAATHGTIRAAGDSYEIENLCTDNPLLVNGREVLRRLRLHNGDQITIGRTVFVFQKRKS